MSDLEKIKEMGIALQKMHKDVTDILINWEEADFDEQTNYAHNDNLFYRFGVMERVEMNLKTAGDLLSLVEQRTQAEVAA